MLSAGPVQPVWSVTRPGVWSAADGSAPLATIEETASFGFVVKNPSGGWLASFSLFGDAMSFVAAFDR